MSDDPTPPPAHDPSPAPDPDPAPDPAPTPGTDLTDLPVPDDADDATKELIRKRNSELAGLRKRAKDAEADAEAWRKHQNDQKPVLDRLTGERDQHKTEAEELRAQLLRRDVADEKGLTAAQAKRLVGSTLEELLADADAFLAEAGGEAPPSTRRPTERLRPGTGDPNSEPDEMDPAALAAKVPRSGF